MTFILVISKASDVQRRYQQKATDYFGLLGDSLLDPITLLVHIYYLRYW